MNREVREGREERSKSRIFFSR